MSVSLYRKYRPQDFASVVGQAPAVSILTNALTKGTAGHAYLFSGSRGCGKTSIARIFAKALNCLHPNGYEPCGTCSNCTAITAGESLDVVEIDGASNNGVENIRSLRENISLSPFSSKHKIYIIDEVHMLSQGAFNALLKTLEEPPEFVVFIMATTEPYRVPVTIRSRCQHIPFHSISTEDICSRLEYVCKSEGVNADSEALYEIARQADGALRDGLSLLEQVISSGEITLENVEALLGAGSRSAFERVVKALRVEPSEGYTALKSMFDGGASGVRVFEEMFSLVRNMWLVSRWRGVSEGLGLSKSERRFLSEEVPNWSPNNLHYMLDRILSTLTKARQGMRMDILLGSFMMSLSMPSETLSQPQVSQPQISQPQPSTLPPEVSAFQEKQSFPEKPVTDFDTKLKQDLLAIALEENFYVYCGLFDATPYTENHSLILDFEHAYCYDRLRVDRTAVKLTVMFKEKYGNVILRHKDDKPCICPDPVDFRPKLPDDKAKAPDPKNLLLAERPIDEDEPEEQEAVPRAEISSRTDEISAPEKEKSGIVRVRQELAGLGVTTELLLSVHRQNTDTDTDIDIEQEGDNDD